MKRRLFLSLCALATLGALVSCAPTGASPLYVPGTLVSQEHVKQQQEGYYRTGAYEKLSSADHPSIEPNVRELGRFGTERRILPSTGEQYLTVIPVDFDDYAFPEGYHERIEAAFFGSDDRNQYVSVAEYYDRSSYHRLHVNGEVTKEAFRSSESYASLKKKNNAAATKAALAELHEEAVAWYNDQGYGRTLDFDSAVFFVYSAPYAGMDGDASPRSSMMWAFAVNEPAPIAWASYHMMHPNAANQVGAHTYIHEFGHLLGLKDYYDVNSYGDLSPVSPLGRMDMMDCSLGEHNAFSKMLLDWARPFVPEARATVRLRQSSGNPDCLLLPLAEFNGTPYDEYLLLEYYTPTYLNHADATMRVEKEMSLFRHAGIKAYHVDGRLGLYETRGKSPLSLLTNEESIGLKTVDFYCDNSGIVADGEPRSSRGFLIQLLDASAGSGALIEGYVASDHQETLSVQGRTVRLRDALFHVGQGIGASTPRMDFHKGQRLAYGFEVVAMTPTYADVEVFPIGWQITGGGDTPGPVV